LYEGLIWLINNNKLYSNVDIVEREEIDFNINEIIFENNKIPTIDEEIITVKVIENIIPMVNNFNLIKGIVLIINKINMISIF
jgi:hypothetical protein